MLALLFSCATLACALLLTGLLKRSADEGRPLRYVLPEQPSGERLLGLGLDLAALEPANIVENPGFSPYLSREAVTVTRVEGRSLIAGLEDAGSLKYGDAFFDGAGLNVTRNSGSRQTLLLGTRVGAHRALTLGPGHALRTEEGEAPALQGLRDVAWREYEDGRLRDALLVGDDGLALHERLGSLHSLNLGTFRRLVAVFADAEGYVVLSEEGDLFISDAEGRNFFRPLLSARPKNWRAKDLVRRGGDIVVCGERGWIMHYREGKESWIQIDGVADLNGLALHGGSLIVAGAQNKLWVNSAGPSSFAYRRFRVPQDEGADPVDWLRAESCAGRLFISGTRQALLVGEDENDLSSPPGLIARPEQGELRLLPLDAARWILQSAQDCLYTEDGGASFKVLEGAAPGERFFKAGRDRLLSRGPAGGATPSGERYTLRALEARFELPEGVGAEAVEPGDLMRLEQIHYALPGAAPAPTPADAARTELIRGWTAEGDCSARVLDPHAGGPRAEVLLGRGTLSQSLPAGRLVEGRVYRLRLQAEASEASLVEVLLSGPFPEQKLLFAPEAGRSAAEELRFVMPRTTGGASEVRLSLRCTGGRLLLKGVFLGLDQEFDAFAPSAAQLECLRAAEAQVLRLSYLGLGGTAAAEQWAEAAESYYCPQTPPGETAVRAGSLQRALRLCRELDAAPWLSFEAYTQHEELRRLVEYLAAPAEEGYGALRFGQGSASPWTSSFERIFFEFKDDAGVYKTAEEKAAFVNALRDCVLSSPYYAQIKNKVVFVDGMDYQGERMLSAADFHARALFATAEEARAAAAHANEDPAEAQGARLAVAEAYAAYLERAPRYVEKEEGPSLLRRLDWPEAQERLSAAEQLYLLLYDYGRDSALVLAAQDFCAARGPFRFNALLAEAEAWASIDDDQASVFAYRRQDRAVVFAFNHGAEALELRLELGAERGDGLRMQFFDANLKALSEGDYPGDGQPLSLLPGGLLVIY